MSQACQWLFPETGVYYGSFWQTVESEEESTVENDSCCSICSSCELPDLVCLNPSAMPQSIKRAYVPTQRVQEKVVPGPSATTYSPGRNSCLLRGLDAVITYKTICSVVQKMWYRTFQGLLLGHVSQHASSARYGTGSVLRDVNNTSSNLSVQLPVIPIIVYIAIVSHCLAHGFHRLQVSGLNY